MTTLVHFFSKRTDRCYYSYIKTIFSILRSDKTIETATLVLTLALGFLILSQLSHEIVHDQTFIRYTFHDSIYPPYNAGITSFLIVGIYNHFIHPSIGLLDLHIRTLAMVMFVGSGYLLARKMLLYSISRVLFLCFLFTSRYMFLWLSSELFVAALLCLSLLCALYCLEKPTNWSVVTAFTLALLALTKPDLPVMSTAIALVLWHLLRAMPTNHHKKFIFIHIFFMIMFIIPGLMVKSSFLDNRSFISLGQHFSHLVYTLQIKPAPTPWDNWGTYKDYLFPSANSFLQFIRTYPVLYCDFIFLSLSQGFRNVIEIFGPLLILPPLSLFFERFEVNRPNKTPINRLLLVTLVGLVPIQIFAFLHERYITRFYPLMIILALLFLEKQIHSKQKFNQLTVASVVITSITINIILLFRDLYPHFPSGIYWFPD